MAKPKPDTQRQTTPLGDVLARLTEMVDGILAADGRFGDVRWLDRGEWEKYVRAIWPERLIRAVDRRHPRL